MTSPSNSLESVGRPFVEMAHSIVWCSVATVGPGDRPRTRILHPLWTFDGATLSGVIATGPTKPKLADLQRSPYLSCSYWTINHDTCRADCYATWATDDETCTEVWNQFKTAPDPVGYDPEIIPEWRDGPTGEAFAVLKLEPYRIRVMPGTVLTGQGGEVLSWQK